MSRPVAMRSNLHNALFVPQDRVLYVAHADHERPAAECDVREDRLRGDAEGASVAGWATNAVAASGSTSRARPLQILTK